MKPQSESKNIVAVCRLYEAHGNPDIVKTVLAPEVRWEVVEGFPHSGIYQGLNGVFDFFTRLFSEFEDWHTEPSEIFEVAGNRLRVGPLEAIDGTPVVDIKPVVLLPSDA